MRIRFRMTAFPVFFLLGLIILFASAVADTSISAQEEKPIDGIVVDDSGKPIFGVSIYGAVWKKCCPKQREYARSGEKGEFHLEHPGLVLYFYKNDFAPQAMLVEPETSEVKITLGPPTSNWALPACAEVGPGQRRIGWGQAGLKFSVPENQTRIQAGAADIDYQTTIVKSKKDDSNVALSFGPFAFSIEPDDEQYLNSEVFTQRNISLANGAVIGLDSWGRLRSGGSWRTISVFGAGGATYRNAPLEDAKLFDSIINSACQIPYPSK